MNILEQFENRGYIILDTDLPTTTIDLAAADTIDIIENGKYSDINFGAVISNRCQDAWKVSPHIKNISLNEKILDVVSALYGNKKVKPFQTLNFIKGTQQPVHSDAVHFNSKPSGLMCGVWVALEDVTMDNGPLVYYPGTHKKPDFLMETFNLPRKVQYYPKYEYSLSKWIEEQQLVPEYGIMKKGQMLIWASNILHGGSPIKNQKSTRLSQVTHCYIEGAIPWRPFTGMTFQPQYIR